MVNYRNIIAFISDFKNSSYFIIISFATHMLFLKIWFLGHFDEPNNNNFFFMISSAIKSSKCLLLFKMIEKHYY